MSFISKIANKLKTNAGKATSRIAAVAAAAAIALTAIPAVEAYAYKKVDLSRTDCSITIEYEAVGGTFKIYKVAELTEDVQFDMTKGSFADYAERINLVGLTSQQWNSTALTLSGIAASDESIEADYTAHIPEEKTVTVSDMPTGLYLVVGDPISYNGKKYMPGASLVCLPDSPDGDNWDYNPTIQPKGAGQPETEYKVLKVWKKDSAQKRPSSIEVNIICNNEVVEVVTLDETNNWSYSWTSTNTDDEWNVSEKTGFNDYAVMVEQNTTSFTITNTYKTPHTPPETPPSTPPGTPPNTPNHPQTGDNTDLITPVIYMIASLAVIVVMLFIRRRRKA